MSSPLRSLSTTNPETRLQEIQETVQANLSQHGSLLERLANGDLRLQSLLYLLYWFHRLRNNSEEQQRIHRNLIEYIGTATPQPAILVESLLANALLASLAKEYVESFLVPIRTVDLVIREAIQTNTADPSILCLERHYYPFGSALPGGMIRDEDEDNLFDLPAPVFAALRVAGEKVLGLAADKIHYARETDRMGRVSFLVRGKTNPSSIRLFPEDEGGYRYHENIKSVLRPADPRHIVDTIAFACEFTGQADPGLIWRKKSSIMSPDTRAGGFAFGHHREIVAFITAQTSIEKERELQEREFVRSLIKQPFEMYQLLRNRFEATQYSTQTSFPELFPVVDRLLSELFLEETNTLCQQIPLLAGVRDKAVISLRQVCLKNRTFCPYLPTLRAIAEAIAVFDLIARQKRGFYENMPKERIVEHNPAKTPFASYHMYRYKYRLDQLLGMVPHEIVVPTFEPLSATDLMRVRGVPIRFIGLSREFLYVDEFEQSPEEFFMHDANHSWRMIQEDQLTQVRDDINQAALIRESCTFIEDYLGRIKIQTTDNEEQRELKKLKKIILFEIVHEDARPFLKKIICQYIQLKEGGAVPFEVPRIDPRTGYMDVVDTLDTGISTLSYVRNKLQHGFYDHIDAQLPQIVDPKYRTAEWIARAAADMLRELKASPVVGAEIDADGYTSYEWLLRRTCAVGPDNIHDADTADPALKDYGDGAVKLNPKRYQAGE